MTEKDQIRIEAFAAHLKAVRIKKGLSQRELASLCDINHKKISLLESAKANLNVTTLIELADGLGVHPKELLNTDFE